MENKTMHYDISYDTCQPEQTLREFNKRIKDMVNRYDGNKFRLQQIEAELEDLLHYIEISGNKPVSDGYKLYRKIAELRRERRACKNENDLLWPVYSHFHATQVLPKLEMVQGECSKVKEAVDGRVYGIKTDVIEETLDKKQEPELQLLAAAE